MAPWRWPLTAFRPAMAGLLAGIVSLGAAGGVLLSRAVLVAPTPHSIEATAFAETLGDLPWSSPAAGLVEPLLAALPREERR